MIRKTIAAVSLALLIVPFTGAAANATECNATQLAKRLLNGTAGECFYDTPPPP